MRELAYTDPFVKVLKEATLVRLDQMAAEDRQRRKELARVQQQERAAQRVAIQRALLEVRFTYTYRCVCMIVCVCVCVCVSE
jgi:hypothetical protein